MMNCPYCGSEMEEGALVSRMVPQWIKKGEKKGTLLNCKKIPPQYLLQVVLSDIAEFNISIILFL